MIEKLFEQQKPLNTLIAIDVGFSCLLENIRNTNPVLAQSLAIDMQQTASQIPMLLPEKAQGVIHILNNWATVLNSLPSQKEPHQQN